MALFGMMAGGVAEGVKSGVDIGYKWHRIGMETDENTRQWLEEGRAATKFENQQQDRSETRAGNAYAAKVLSRGMPTGDVVGTGPAATKKSRPPGAMMLGGEPNADRSQAIDSQPRGPNTGVAHPVQPTQKNPGTLATPVTQAIPAKKSGGAVVAPAGGEAVAPAVGGVAVEGTEVFADAPQPGADQESDVSTGAAGATGAAGKVAARAGGIEPPPLALTRQQALEIWQNNPQVGAKYYDAAIEAERTQFEQKIKSAELADRQTNTNDRLLNSAQLRAMNSLSMSKDQLKIRQEVGSKYAWEAGVHANRLDPSIPIFAGSNRGIANQTIDRLADAYSAIRNGSELIEKTELSNGFIVRFRDPNTKEILRTEQFIGEEGAAKLNQFVAEIGAVASTPEGIAQMNASIAADKFREVHMQKAQADAVNAADASVKQAKINTAYNKLASLVNAPDSLNQIDEIDSTIADLNAMAPGTYDYKRTVANTDPESSKPTMVVSGNHLVDLRDNMLDNRPVSYIDGGRKMTARPTQLEAATRQNVMERMKELSTKGEPVVIEELMAPAMAKLETQGLSKPQLVKFGAYMKTKLQEYQTQLKIASTAPGGLQNPERLKAIEASEAAGLIGMRQ